MRENGVSVALVFLSVTFAASAQVRGPIMGYLAEGSTLRTLYGIPAAGAVGDLLVTDRPFSRIEVSPDQTRALGLTADTGALMLLTPGAQVATNIDGAASGADRIVFSPSGTAAALWFSATRRIQVVSGLSATLKVHDLDASFLSTDPAAFALSDDGQWVAGAWSSGTYAFGPDGRVTVLPVDGSPQALCFFHGRNDIAAITATQVVVIADIAGAAASAVIWSKPHDSPPDDPAAAPPAQVAVGLAVSFDNSHLSVAGNFGGLFTFNLNTGENASGNCDCSPTGLFGMSGSLFRLTGLNDGALKVFDASTNEVWFVPLAVPTVAAAGGAQ